MKTEHILAVPASVFANTAEGFGFETVELKSGDVVIHQREGLETDPTYRQLITYNMVRCKDKFLAYVRTKDGNEARLHGNVSIGFGGHVDLDDVIAINGAIEVDATLLEAAKRELREEVVLGTVNQIRTQPELIVSNATETDKVHTGIVSIVDVVDEQAHANETQIELLGWFTLDELREQFGDRLESWSAGLVEDGRAFLG